MSKRNRSGWVSITNCTVHIWTLPQLYSPYNNTCLKALSINQKKLNQSEFTGARANEWQWHQPGCMPIYTLPQTDNHASTPPLSFLQAACLSCCSTNSVKVLKARYSAHNKYTLLPQLHALLLLMLNMPSIPHYPQDFIGRIPLSPHQHLNTIKALRSGCTKLS